jgi:hypothetical protein
MGRFFVDFKSLGTVNEVQFGHDGSP